MASLALQKLWRLHQIDASLAEIRHRAAALDPGRSIMAKIATLEKELKESDYKALHAEQTDLELQQKSTQDKIKKFNAELYGGKVVNPREIEGFEKEIASLKKRLSELEDHWLEVSEKLAPAKESADTLEKKLEGEKADLKEHQKRAVATKTQLESEFKRFSAARPEAAKDIDPDMLVRYDSIRTKHEGVGMADAKKGSCAACGMRLSERTMILLKEDRVVTCEQCHRILYYSEGIL